MTETKTEGMRESPNGRSVISSFQRCERFFAFKYVKGFMVNEKSTPLVVGSAMHEAQEAWYKGKSTSKCLEVLRKSIPRNCPDERAKCTAMFLEWHKQVGLQDRKLMKPLAVEQESYFELLNGYRMSVRWDRVLQYMDSEEIIVDDTKTTGWSLNSTIQNYFYHDQPILYCGALIDHKPQWRKNFRGWTTDCVYGRKVKTGYNVQCKRSDVVMPTQQLIEDTRVSYSKITDDIAFAVQSVLKGGEKFRTCFSKNNGNCLAFNRPCPYHNFCEQIDEMDSPPGNMVLDPWLKDKVVLQSFLDLEV